VDERRDTIQNKQRLMPPTPRISGRRSTSGCSPSAAVEARARMWKEGGMVSIAVERIAHISAIVGTREM